jgi:hypothetical protein
MFSQFTLFGNIAQLLLLCVAVTNPVAADTLCVFIYIVMYVYDYFHISVSMQCESKLKLQI